MFLNPFFDDEKGWKMVKTAAEMGDNYCRKKFRCFFRKIGSKNILKTITENQKDNTK